MHESGKYIKTYKFFLDRLEQNTSDPELLDTVAWVYLDNGNQENAIKIYKEKVLPAINKTGDKDKIKKYEAFFKKISTRDWW